VLGHEIAHALREHVREQMSQAMVAQGVIDVGAAVLSMHQLCRCGLRLLATRFSRTDESEADRSDWNSRACWLYCWNHVVANDGAKGRNRFLSPIGRYVSSRSALLPCDAVVRCCNVTPLCARYMSESAIQECSCMCLARTDSNCRTLSQGWHGPVP
jgi:hypothetical protein